MKFTNYDAGTPCWADLTVQDAEKARDFYGKVFGWEFDISTDPMTNFYTQCKIGDEVVCGINPARMPNQPSAWSTYIATDDIDATCAKTIELGGKIVMPAMEVMGLGKMAVIQDPQGAFICYWESGIMAGSTIANEINTVCWNELATTDLEAAKEFYSAIFGYGDKDSTDEYFQFSVNGEVRGGARELSEVEAKMMPAYWGIYFRVDDLASATSKIEAAGGRVLTEKMNADKIEFQSCMDNQGAVFMICQFEDASK